MGGLMAKLVKCRYGELEGEGRENCCLRSCCDGAEYGRCPVFDWEACPFGKRVEGCGTCANAVGMTLDEDGGRMVDCGANDMQMYSPYATECKHWERAIG